MKYRLQTFLILIMLTCATLSYSQVWSPAGNGIAGFWSTYHKAFSDVHNNELYVAHSNGNTINVHRWDGLNWKAYPSLNPGGDDIVDFVVSNTGMFVIVDGSSLSFYEFNGTSWVGKAPTGYNGYSKTAEDVNGDLVVGGNFTTSVGISNIYKYDGSNFSAMPAGPIDVIDIHEFQGTLYIADNRNFTSTNPNGLLEFNGSAWNQTVHHFKQGTTTTKNSFKIFDFQNELYVGDSRPWGSAVVYKAKADSLERVDSLGIDIKDWVAYNNDLYLVGDILIKYDGSTFSTVSSAPGDVHCLDTLNQELYLVTTTNNGNWGNVSFNHVLRTQPGYSVLSGSTYLDYNANCILDNNEPKIPGVILGISGIVITSNKDGDYSLGLPAGTYQFDTTYVPYYSHKNIGLNCVLPNSITMATGQLDTQDVGFDFSVPVDMVTTISCNSGYTPRHGFNEKYTIEVTNAGNTAMTQTSVTVVMPSTVNYVSSVPAPSSQTGNTLTYTLTGIYSLESKQIDLTVNIDPINNLGDTLVWTSTLGAVPGDADLSDNSDTLYQTIIGAYDPNDKQASRNEIGPGTKSIDYQIRFQNTGTAPAYKVTIVDTLDVTLPITNIMIKTASHPYNFSVVNNIMIWEFDNIMLPDSGADYLGSQGYVRFSAGINPSLGIGDTIENDAEIYFDYQPPVHTNHAKTAIVNNIGLDEGYEVLKALEVYPNPASDRLYLKNTAGEALEVRMFSAAGKEVLSLGLDPSGVHSLDLENFPSGVYIINSDAGSYRVIVKD